MDEILGSYKEKLEEKINEVKREIEDSVDMSRRIDEIRDDLSSWGKSNLNLLFLELKGYIEKNNPSFIKDNDEKWKEILDRAKALTEYGLYVAPLELVKGKSRNIVPVYVGVGGFLGGSALSKVLFRRSFMLINALLSGLGGAVSYYVLGPRMKERRKKLALEYIDEVKDWIETAFENMVRVFKEAA